MLILTVASCAIEYKITDKRPAVRAWLGSHRLVALAASLGLSLLLGTLFGAAGMICFGAGMLSTIVMNGLYAIQPTLAEYAPAFKLMVRVITSLIKLIFAIIVLPFVAITKIANIFNIKLVD